MNLLTLTRDLAPKRPLSLPEASQLAERQATKLIHLGQLEGPPVPETLITELPGLHVERVRPLAVPGAAGLRGDRWVVLLNADDARTRQRFSLAHEFKHILDHGRAQQLYPATPLWSPRDRVEAVCNFFAGCLLVPVIWLKRAFREGITEVRELAQLFEVSQAAMRVRLAQVGLVERAAGGPGLGGAA